MPWLFLLLAGACEMIWPIGFKFTGGFTRNWPLVAFTAALLIFSFYLMSLATRGGIHIGTAYAVWTGLGAAGTALLGILLFNEPRDLLRLSCLGLIIVGVIGLKFLAPPEKPIDPATAFPITTSAPTPPEPPK